MNKKIYILEKLYLLLSITIAAVIIFTPLIINSGISIIPEEVLEVIVIALLFGIGSVLLRQYRKEVEKNLLVCDNLTKINNNLEERLMSAFKHIGSVNIQIDEVRSAFSEIKKYPENKRDFKYLLQFFGIRVLCMTDADWVIFRIVDATNTTTLGEYCEARGDNAVINQKVSNKNLLENGSITGCKIIKSSQENFYIKTFCIIQTASLNRDQEILIKAIVNQLEMLFLIYTSNNLNKAIDGKNIPAGSYLFKTPVT
jgi:hypothetical protein